MTSVQKEALVDLSFWWSEFIKANEEFDRSYEDRNWGSLAESYKKLNMHYDSLLSSECVNILSVEHSKVKAIEVSGQKSIMNYTCLEAELAEAIGAKNKYDEIKWVVNSLEGELTKKDDELNRLKNLASSFESKNGELERSLIGKFFSS